MQLENEHKKMYILPNSIYTEEHEKMFNIMSH